MTSHQNAAVPAADPARRRREQIGWYFYDWANQPFFTTVTTAFGAAYIGGLASDSAQADIERNGPDPCVDAAGSANNLVSCDIELLFLQFPAGVLWNYLVATATVIQFFVLPVAGAITDRSRNKRLLLAIFAFTGATAVSMIVFAAGTNWQLAAGMYLIGQVSYGGSIVVYYSFLADVAYADERDTVSTRGWAMGYLGGGIALALQLVLVLNHDAVGLTQTESVRLAFLSSGIWWAGFTLIPLFRLRQHSAPRSVEPGRSPLTAGFVELGKTLRGALAFPLTLWFLGAYLIYSDGISTVVSVSAQYGKEQLGFAQDVLIITILVVQFLAFIGARLHGLVAERTGAKRTIMASLLLWIGVLIAAYHLEPGNELMFWSVAAAIGLVLGGVMALSRSLFSQLIPPGKEAQYFGLYLVTERGTPQFGTALFGLIAQASGSFRPAIIALAVFFILGFLLLAFLPVRRAIRAAGNTEPAVV
ncbi:MFS transporter [Haloechinothrix sp. YIM 98757]|uniref:MFS transporter n=1 Tax=Haloechinothrix aidingensis TaxID=2752311 RepID=A0A838AA14_9PSEU|nr:MFS transporter [Haloechinothrix aidingensis]MBA0125839.1 MFS transporter [Haloechinothrix aidingensis]